MPDSAQLLAAALQDRYRVDRELGQGGMATVYLAHDLKHHRQVALKVLRPELAAALGPEGFLREITLTAQRQGSRRPSSAFYRGPWDLRWLMVLKWGRLPMRLWWITMTSPWFIRWVLEAAVTTGGTWYARRRRGPLAGWIACAVIGLLIVVPEILEPKSPNAEVFFPPALYGLSRSFPFLVTGSLLSASWLRKLPPAVQFTVSIFAYVLATYVAVLAMIFIVSTWG